MMSYGQPTCEKTTASSCSNCKDLLNSGKRMLVNLTLRLFFIGPAAVWDHNGVDITVGTAPLGNEDLLMNV